MDQLFAKKKLEVLLAEMEGENRLRRVLGPIGLSALGIGAIIGTGIFVLTGLAARNDAGPGLVISYVIAGAACAFAALCYSEFAAMAPVAGSAYTYAYTTLGEWAAWIIGWDLVLEYAIGSAAVASGWAHYFASALKLVGISSLPVWLTIDPFTAAEHHRLYQVANAVVIESATCDYGDQKNVTLPLSKEIELARADEVYVSLVPKTENSSPKISEKDLEIVAGRISKKLKYEPHSDPAKNLKGVVRGFQDGHNAYMNTPLQIGPVHFTFNLMCIVIVAFISLILIIGIRESAGFNNLMVGVKLAAVLFVIFAGVGHVDTSNWSPLLPYGWTGVLTGAGAIFFAYIGFDSISTHAEEAKNPQRDVPIGIIASLAICTVLYILVTAILVGMVPYPEIPIDAPIAGVFEAKGLKMAHAIITVGALTGITSVLLVMLLSQPRILLAMARDGLLPASFFGAVHEKFKTPYKSTILTGIVSAIASAFFPLESLGHMVSIGTLFAFVVVCGAVWMMRFSRPEQPRPFRVPCMNFVAPAGMALCLLMMISLGLENWLRLIIWLALGQVIYFGYSMKHSTLGKELRGETTQPA